jgi:hypothetical protein
MKAFLHLWQGLVDFSLKWEVYHTEVVERLKTHSMFNIFFFENRAIYEVMWKNLVEPDKPQITI